MENWTNKPMTLPRHTCPIYFPYEASSSFHGSLPPSFSHFFSLFPLFFPFFLPFILSLHLYIRKVSCTPGRSQAYDGARLVLNTWSSWGVGVTDKHCQDQLDSALSNIIFLFEDQSLFLEWMCTITVQSLISCIFGIFVYVHSFHFCLPPMSMLVWRNNL